MSLSSSARLHGGFSTLDNLTKQQRNRTMRAVRSTDTSPELLVRRLIFSLGYRYRLHGRKLPGCPDILFPAQRKVIFVHGCFWHGHACASGKNRPKTNVSYWEQKLARTRARDEQNRVRLAALKWRILILWECELRKTSRLRRRITRFLQSTHLKGPSLSIGPE